MSSEYLAAGSYERIRRLKVVMLVVPFFLSLLFFLIYWTDGFTNFTAALGLIPIAPLVAGIFSVTISFLTLIMLYLQGDITFESAFTTANKSPEKDSDKLRNAMRQFIDSYPLDAIQNLQQTVETLSTELEAVRDQIVGRDDQNKHEPSIASILVARAKEEAITDIWEELERKASVAFEKKRRDGEITDRFDDAHKRLLQEISALGRRGNLNLGIGIVTTAAGLILLGIFVFNEIRTAMTPIEFGMHFLPRLTLVVFIEIFAYFFLSLYKSTLAEIKYFQNEITNMEAKYISIKTALTLADAKVIGDVVGKVVDTERNHVLDKGQTTVELERARIENARITDGMKHAAGVFSRRRKAE